MIDVGKEAFLGLGTQTGEALFGTPEQQIQATLPAALENVGLFRGARAVAKGAPGTLRSIAGRPTTAAGRLERARDFTSRALDIDVSNEVILDNINITLPLVKKQGRIINNMQDFADGTASAARNLFQSKIKPVIDKSFNRKLKVNINRERFSQLASETTLDQRPGLADKIATAIRVIENKNWTVGSLDKEITKLNDELTKFYRAAERGNADTPAIDILIKEAQVKSMRESLFEEMSKVPGGANLQRDRITFGILSDVRDRARKIAVITKNIKAKQSGAKAKRTRQFFTNISGLLPATDSARRMIGLVGKTALSKFDDPDVLIKSAFIELPKSTPGLPVATTIPAALRTTPTPRPRIGPERQLPPARGTEGAPTRLGRKSTTTVEADELARGLTSGGPGLAIRTLVNEIQDLTRPKTKRIPAETGEVRLGKIGPTGLEPGVPTQGQILNLAAQNVRQKGLTVTQQAVREELEELISAAKGFGQGARIELP